MDKKVLGVIGVVLLLGVGYWLHQPETRTIQVPVQGALSSPDVLSYMSVHGVFTQGGGIRATSTVNTAETLLGSDFDTENVIDYTANGAVAGTTITLPASTTVPLGTDVGSARTVWIRNATTTAATSLTIAGGTGTLLKVASSSPSAAVIYGDTDAGNHASLFFLRKANSDIEVFFQSYKD